MSDVLSQDEIDNLLAALSSGELDADEIKSSNEKQVKNYDFARPSKFSKEHLRTLEIVFEHYGRLVSTSMPLHVRKNVAVQVMNSEETTYFEFVNALSNPVLLGVVSLYPLQGNILIEMADNLGFAIVDRMLGGYGVPMDKTRDFSEVELTILERVFVTLSDLLVEPWQNVVDIQPKLERIETNSQFAQIVSPSEMVSIVTMNFQMGDVTGMMNICLPFSCLESVIDRLNTKYWYSNMQEKDSLEYKEVIEVAIEKAKIPIRAVLGKSVISVNEFTNLQIGDIIKLNTKVNEELDVYVGNIRKFSALPGASQDSYAVRIQTIHKEE